ncbi:MAG: CARDB domain-containing protein [Cruoricaptor ignavus]|nr:CARDB domain-containing protein [Cruoricaptor ignavus]
MKFISTLFLLFAFIFANGQNVLKINDLEAGPGESTKLIVSLDNAEAVSGFQIKIALPQGLIVKERETKLVGRETDHVVYPKRLSGGEYLFVCFSAKGENFTGNSGNLLEIPVELAINLAPGTVLQTKFTESILSSSLGQGLLVNTVDGTIKVTDGKTADLMPVDVSSSSAVLAPNSEIIFKWNVKNIGQLDAENGWQEQIAIVSEISGKRYIVGNTFYNSTLSADATVARERKLILPKVFGIDGNVKVEVKIIPNSGLKEPESLKGNNVALSQTLTLSKKLSVELDRTEIAENSLDKVRVNIVRSGDISTEETVTLSSQDNAFGSPLTVVLGVNQSSNFVYLQPVNNQTYEGDRDIVFNVKSNSYADEQATIKLIDDEHIILILSYPKDADTSLGKEVAFTLSANFPKSQNQTIQLSTDFRTRLKLPAEVILSAGETSVGFTAEIIDTGLVEKSQDVTVFAKATGYNSGVSIIKLKSSGLPDFNISLSEKQISEGDGVKATYAKIYRTTNIDREAIVAISEDPKGNLILPSEIFFEKGVAEKTFAVGVIDNSVVEGNRHVDIWVKTKFSSCNCTDNTELGASASATLEVLDNDGLALSVLPQPSTLKAGASGKLKIFRNAKDSQILQNSVFVKLSSDNAVAISLPDTAVIPAGVEDISVDYTTMIDTNSHSDKTVRITAEAEGYTSGFGWLLLTNQNKGDIEIENISVPSSIQSAEKIKVSTNYRNIGYADFASGAKVDYYLSKTDNISGLTPITTSYITKVIQSGEAFSLVEEILLPPLAGNQYLIIVVNSDNAISELSDSNNRKSVLLDIKPSYTVSVETDKKVYKQGEIIKITGVAKTAEGTPVASSPVEITIKNDSFTRVFPVKTNVDGLFVYDFTPIQNEAGTYSIFAAYPGATSTSAIHFDILGFEILNKPQYIKWEVLVNIPLGKEFNLKNNTKTKLTDVKIELPNNYPLKIEQNPVTIEANSTAVLSYKIISSEASKEFKFEEIPLKITSSEGAAIREIVYLHSRMPQPTLQAEPVSINTTMIKGQKRIYEFIVKNIGAADAEEIEVKLPTLDWMRLASSEKINLIKAGEEGRIALELEPTVKEQINVPTIGNLVLKPKNGNTLSVPFTIETVSTDTGKLVVDAVDEYFYNTAEAPHLKGAKVTVKHPYTGAVISEGITNDNGIFQIPDLKEGWYTILVSADKHNPYQNNILVDPGKETSILAFLPYQAVSYSWDVKPTDITDEYDIKLNVEFETNVPKPVIVMEIDNNKLDLKSGESRMTYITVTNHGLIAANNVKISISDVPGYTFKPLINSMEVLNAKSSIVIPVLLTNTETTSGKLSARDSKVCFSGNVLLEAEYPCGGEDEKLFSYEMYVSISCKNPTRTPIGGGIGGVGSPYCTTHCGWAGGDYATATATNFTPLDLCDPCTKKIIQTFFKCMPQTVIINYILCGLDILTIKDFLGILYAIENCENAVKKTIKKVECPGEIACTILECLSGMKTKTPKISGFPQIKLCDYLFKKRNKKGNDNPKTGKTLFANEDSSYEINIDDFLISNPEKDWDNLFNDFVMFTLAQEARFDKINAYLSDWDIVDDEEKLYVVLENLADYIDNKKRLSPQDIANINAIFVANGISENFIGTFADRWNTTLEAWGKGILSPNANYPNIIDKVELDYYDNTTDVFSQYLTKRGFVSIQELYTSNMADIEKFQKEKEEEGASVCATVSLEFPQKMTMTREAFEGTLRINNSSSKEVKDINLDLIVTDDNGENKTALFQINKDAFINGTGLVSAGEEGSGKALFIPTKEAAPQVPQSYNFGGILSYFDAEINERVFVTLQPVTLQVNPSPDLELHYFMQRNILGDDPLTEDKVEPIIPAELSLMIKNDGYGEAKNVNVESMQPKIVENEKGLAIDFNMIGSNLNNQPMELGLLNVNFGSIPPKTSAVGQWWFTSSLMGHFVHYDVKVNHASSFGNSKLSLVKATYIHELIKSVKDYRDGADNISDFLVNGIADAHDTPDRLYLSNGTSEEVFKAESLQNSEKVTSSQRAVKLIMKPYSTGWNYGLTDDPGAGIYKLERIVRDNDQKEIPLNNFWQTHVTLKDGLNPKYEHNLHVLDYISEPTTYTLHYKPADGNLPEVIAFEDVPLENSPKSVEAVKVRFNKEIDVNTFTNNNIELIYQGAKLPSDNILIGKIDATTYSISLKGLTDRSGYYQLTVNTLGIKDMVGNEGLNGKKISWIQFINELGILDFKTDQLKKQPLNTVTVIFNKKIRSEEFTADKITINDKAIPNVIIRKQDDYTYAISGIQEYNADDAEYIIKISTDKISSVEGIKGIAEQSYKWLVNTTIPQVTSITPWYQGALHTQHITDFEIKLNEKLVSGFEASAISLFRDNQKLPVELHLSNQDDTTYIVTNLFNHTSQNGSYKLIINQSSFKNENENIGSGQKEYQWQVNRQNLSAVSNLRLMPDKGISSTDNITSGEVKLAFETLQDNLNIEVYEMQATKPILIETVETTVAGAYTIPVNGVSGSKRFKVVGYDKSGNISEPIYLNGYIDNTDFDVTVEPVKLLNDVCSGFDYVNVKFSQPILDFTKEAITVTSSGVVVPQNQISIKKIDDSNYVIENLITDNREEAILNIDRTKISKKLSGLVGSTKYESVIGVVSFGAINIDGKENPVIGETITYKATDNMHKYDWIAINGEIQKSESNTVNVKWQKVGQQSLVLKYQTPAGCTATLVKNVDVLENGSSLDTADLPVKKSVKVAPVPNNGHFTIFTNKVMPLSNIMIYDMSGRLVHEQKNVTIDYKFDVFMKNATNGIYTIIIYNTEDRYQFRFIVK